MEKFRFPVVYASGKTAFEKLEGETFVGVICGGVLISAQDAPKKMNYVQALEFAQSTSWGGKRGRMFNRREAAFVFHNLDEVNKILSAFSDQGAQPLSKECYWLMLEDSSQIADMGVKSVVRGVAGSGEYCVRSVFYCYTQLGEIKINPSLKPKI